MLYAARARVIDLAHQVRRRWRATARLMRVDAPTRWRMVSHAAVLVLSVGVFVSSRWSQSAARAAEVAGDAGDSEVTWAAGLVGREASEWLTPGLVPDTVTTTKAPARADVPDYGFLSP
ncbi:MAG: hypothetical protein ABI780_02860, partial [Ardenticatenales bacterium]